MRRDTQPYVIFAAAFLVRLLHVATFARLPYYRQPFGDSLAYVREADVLLRNGPFASDLSTFQGPLYPLFLALLRAVGLPVSSAYWIQAATGALTVALVARLAARWHSRSAGWIAGGLYALYDVAIFLDGDLLAASLVATLVALALVLLLPPSTASPRAALRAASGGAALALAAWGAPNLALPALALVVWGFARCEKRRLVPFAAALGLVLLAPTARSLLASGEPLFLASSGGVNFYIGNHRGATGTFRIPPESGLANDPDLAEISRREAMRELGHDVSPGGASRFWLRRGLADLAARPDDAGRLYARKALLLVNRRDVPNHLDIDFLRAYCPVLAWTPVRSWLLFVLGAAGVVVVASRRAGGPSVVLLAAGAASLLPFFVTDRYRLPFMPVLGAAAGVFVASGLQRVRSRVRPRGERGSLRAAAWVGAGTAVATFLPLIPKTPAAAAYVNLGASYAAAGDTMRARHALLDALAQAPREPRALENLAVLALEGEGGAARALSYADQAVTADPRAYSAWMVRATALGGLGRFDDAVESAERSLAIRPDWEAGRSALASLWREYLAYCQRLAGEAGIGPPQGPAERERFAAFLEEHALVRAAAKVRAFQAPGR